MNYIDFLKSKIAIAPNTGFEISKEDLHPALKPHQKDAVQWALKGGRRALFEAFGLGKTIQELEWCRQCVMHTGGKALIVLPLGVRQEFKRDAVQLLGMEEPLYITRTEQATEIGIYLTNYERVRDGGVDPKAFDAVALDEASVLRSYGSKTFQEFMPMMKGVKFKLVATATPAPNKYKELIHYAGYLEIMDTGQALTRFFQRDSTKANNLTLYPHKEKEFWLWMSSWALFLTKPSQLGYEDTGYELPGLEVRYHKLTQTTGTHSDKNGQMILTKDASLSLPAAAKEKKDSLVYRIAKAKEIVDSDPDAHFILWHDREDERHEIKRVFPDSVEVYGTLDYDIREQRILDFADGKNRLLATKKEISGQGCNFQRHCHRAIFVGIDYKFNDFIQAIHRIYRFLQTEKVIIDIIYTENEKEILQVLKEKWQQHDEMVEQMTDIIKEYGLNGRSQLETLARSIGVERKVQAGENYMAIHNDCVLETACMADNSIDLIHTSIPFSNHYEYTPSYNDFGHNENTVKFFEQMDFLTPQLLRILKPGRVAAIHVKDRVLFGNATGYGMPTMEPFHAMCIQHYMKHGFMYFGMITVTTDVVRENNQTYRLGWTEQCKDATKMGVGCPEYILLFRKLPTDTTTAYADTPVTKAKEEYTLGRWQIDAHGFWRSSGNRMLTGDELMSTDMSGRIAKFKAYSKETVYDFEKHVQLADELAEKDGLSKTFMTLPTTSINPEVWDDVVRMNTLNKEQRLGRRELHVCPLQIDIVDRIITRYSNKGDTVFDPFGGIMTVPYRAVKMGRKGIGTELNPDYFKDGCRYLETAEIEMDAPTLFDLMGDI